MRVLLLSLWYHPEPVTKPHDLASELVRRGFDVCVVTSFPNYPAGKLYSGYRQSLWRRETIDGVDVIRVPMVIDRSRSGIRRILSYTSFSASAVLGAMRLVPRPDVVWTYQIGLPGVAIARLQGARLVHEVQDLWPEWTMSGGMSMSSLAYRILDRQEKMIYHQAAALTTISVGFQHKLMDKGVPAQKITVIPNWANEQHFRPVVPDESLAIREGLAGRFNIIYGGNIGTAQGLKVVLDAAELLRDLPSVQFVMIGDGLERESLAREGAERGINNLRFLGSRPPEQMASYYALASALLLPLKRDPAYELTIPSKTYAYLASGRPVLAAATGEVAALIDELNAGVVCDPEDPGALALAVRTLVNTSVSEREAFGAAGRQAFVKRFRRQVLCDRYEELFAGIVTAPSLRV